MRVRGAHFFWRAQKGMGSIAPIKKPNRMGEYNVPLPNILTGPSSPQITEAEKKVFVLLHCHLDQSQSHALSISISFHSQWIVGADTSLIVEQIVSRGHVDDASDNGRANLWSVRTEGEGTVT